MDFLGLPYPVKKHAQGFFHSQGGISQIKSDLLTLLLTNPGERVYLPTYGTPLRKLIFEPNLAGLEFRVKQAIAESIRRWEPRIQLSQIEVKNKLDEASKNNNDDMSEAENVLSVKVIFIDPQNIKDLQELVLELPLSGS